jgi:hypothetical protein
MSWKKGKRVRVEFISRDIVFHMSPTPVSALEKRIRDTKISGSGYGVNIPDHFSESLETVIRVKNT